MKGLRYHFAGEGNATINIAKTERIRDSLQYSDERLMAF